MRINTELSLTGMTRRATKNDNVTYKCGIDVLKKSMWTVDKIKGPYWADSLEISQMEGEVSGLCVRLCSL